MENAHPRKKTDLGTNSNISAFRPAKSSSGFPDQSKKNQTQQTQISPETAKRLICSTTELFMAPTPKSLVNTEFPSPETCRETRRQTHSTQPDEDNLSAPKLPQSGQSSALFSETGAQLRYTHLKCATLHQNQKQNACSIHRVWVQICCPRLRDSQSPNGMNRLLPPVG